MREATHLGQSAFFKLYLYECFDHWSSDHDLSGFETPAVSAAHLTKANPEETGKSVSPGEVSPGEQD
jgi:hypothetical protein